MCTRISSMLCASSTVLSLAVNAAPTTKHPNIIIMQADDMGYDDMSLRGNTCVSTPHLDQLAQSAISFENFYVHSVSAPTRASLLTGRHFLRTGVSGVHAGRDFVNLNETMISEAFQQAGYKTGMWGKWHSGKSAGYFPWDRGFDEAFMAALYHYRNNKGELNGVQHATEGWVDAVIADMAIDFIKENKNEPFFAYVPFLSPHGKWDAPQEYVNRKMSQGQGKNFATLNGMLEHLDDQIGKIMSAVEKEGLLENTIIIFLSDNGPITSGGTGNLSSAEWAQRNPSGYKGNKGQNFENGIHSPLFIYWKGHYESAVNESLVAVYDLFPTLCDVAKVKIPKGAKELDGVSFKKMLENPTKTKTDRSLYISQWTPFFEWHNSDQQAVALTPERRESINPLIQMIGVRSGDDKMLYNMWGCDTVAFWNVKDDHKEEKDLWVNGTSDDKDKALAYRADALAWYNEVLEEENTYQMPTFLIGYNDVKTAQIFCYAPSELSDGLENTNHFLAGFDQVGERAEYKVNVVKEGAFTFGIRPWYKHKGEAVFQIYTNLDDNCGEITVTDKATTWKLLKLTKDVEMIGIRMIQPSEGECSLVSIDILDKN